MRRGYRGRIVKVTPTEVRVELEAQQRSVGVPRDAIPPEHGGAPLPREPPRFGAAPNTPAHLGMHATPSHRWVRCPLKPFGKIHGQGRMGASKMLWIEIQAMVFVLLVDMLVHTCMHATASHRWVRASL
jgi:hypothetical protein